MKYSVLGVLFVVSFLSACSTLSPEMRLRQERIQAEPLGDYFVGRRYYIKKARLWGYLRKPREPWSKARLVIMNEKYRAVPDRIPESKTEGKVHGYDHNYAYKIYGYFSGEHVYDPHTDLILPEFVLKDYEVLDKEPGFLFSPREVYRPNRLPRKEKNPLP